MQNRNLSSYAQIAIDKPGWSLIYWICWGLLWAPFFLSFGAPGSDCQKTQKKWPLTVCSFSELLFQSRVISVHSYYLTSLVTSLSWIRTSFAFHLFLFLILKNLLCLTPSIEKVTFSFSLSDFGFDELLCPFDSRCLGIFSDP